MPKYTVNLTRTTTSTASIIIEAPSSDEAADLAEEMCNKAIDGNLEGDEHHKYSLDWDLEDDTIEVYDVNPDDEEDDPNNDTNNDPNNHNEDDEETETK